MTRRDYCFFCKEMVSDFDPCCSTCGESYCASCLDPQDENSDVESNNEELDELDETYVCEVCIEKDVNNKRMEFLETQQMESDKKIVQLENHILELNTYIKELESRTVL